MSAHGTHTHAQGREEEGRALLTRALANLERTLGPSHPDVLTMRDVLYGGDA